MQVWSLVEVWSRSIADATIPLLNTVLCNANFASPSWLPMLMASLAANAIAKALGLTPPRAFRAWRLRLRRRYLTLRAIPRLT